MKYQTYLKMLSVSFDTQYHDVLEDADARLSSITKKKKRFRLIQQDHKN